MEDKVAFWRQLQNTVMNLRQQAENSYMPLAVKQEVNALVTTLAAELAVAGYPLEP